MMLEKTEIRPSKIHGMGVFAAKEITGGEVIHKIDDSRVVDDQHPLKPQMGEDFIHRDWLPDGTTILMKKPAGYFNHSCDPNVFVYSVDRQRFILSMREINAGEELFFDYSINALDGDVWECKCGSPNCRRRHKCGFFLLPDSRQLEYLPFLDPWFADVHRDRICDLLERSLKNTVVCG